LAVGRWPSAVGRRSQVGGQMPLIDASGIRLLVLDGTRYPLENKKADASKCVSTRVS